MVTVRHSRQEFHARAAGLVGLVVAAALATGCKSGSWGAKPSWWSSSGTPSASALTAAPSFDKDVAKPSETAKPYPTTSTPEGYALSDATKTDAGGSAASPPGLVEPTAVTYGSTPPPAAAQPVAVAQPAAAAPPPAAVAGQSVGPQVGPYASIQPQSPTPPPPASIDPAGAATAGMAAAPAFGEASPPLAQMPPAQPLAAQPPAARYADASGSQAWAAAPPPATPPAAAPGFDGRYGDANASRFGPPPAGFAAPPAAAPPIAPIEPPPAVPAAAPAAAGGDALPGAIAPPTRRPDPGYRPLGTSSYRPGKTILTGDEPATPGVVPASFEAAPAGG
jgi:hypothetical protein